MRLGKMDEDSVFCLEQLPASSFPAFTAACQLITAHDFIAFFVLSIDMRLDYPRIAMISKFQDAFFFNCLANRLVHAVSCDFANNDRTVADWKCSLKRECR